jgi:hypothetical protein
MVDHQVAHIYVNSQVKIDQIKKCLDGIPGIDKILSTEREKFEYQINHARSGDLIAISDNNKWFTYYWWYDPAMAPPFVTTVDIHRKPGYDPVELFLDHSKKSIPLDAGLVKSSHGRPLQWDNGDPSPIFITSRREEDVNMLLKKESITSADLGSYLIESNT